MTLTEIKESERDILYPADIAAVLHITPQKIRERAKLPPNDPYALKFPVQLSGKKRTVVHIPRHAFIAFMEGRI